MKTPLLRVLQAFTLSLSSAVVLAASTNEILVTTMESGGANGVGVIYSINPDGTQAGIAITFNGANGANPTGNLIQAPDQKVYGTTSAGGNNNFGVLFRYNPESPATSYTVLHHFSGTDGWAPRNIHLKSNVIYGTTNIGGTHTGEYSQEGMGVLYSYDINSGLFNKLIDFEGTNGENPQGVIHGIDNNLYGLTRQGGDSGFGVLYRLNPANNTYTKLHDFAGYDGRTPSSSKMMQTSNNVLYGTTTWGGNNDMGVLFKFDMAHDMYTVLHHFDIATGRYPEGVLTEVNGVLYGITPYGGANGEGVVYSYNTNTGVYMVIHTFSGEDGRTPTSGLTLGADGNLYGLTTNGGLYGEGVIFSIDPATNTYAVIAHNNEATGSKPQSTLLELTNTLTTGISKVAGIVSLFPNPAVSTINFNISNYNATSVIISDINGNNVLQSPYTSSIDISNLAAGSYFVQITGSENVPPLRTRIIKQ